MGQPNSTPHPVCLSTHSISLLNAKSEYETEVIEIQAASSPLHNQESLHKLIMGERRQSSSVPNGHALCVYVNGGIHGNEPAGFRAAQQVSDWACKHLLQGKLIVVPQANKPACTAKQRWTPFGPDDEKDVILNFPCEAGDHPRGVQAEGIYNLICQNHCAIVFDLHESYDFYYKDIEIDKPQVPYSRDPSKFHKSFSDPLNPKPKARIGNTILVTNPLAESLAQLMCETINREIRDSRKHFTIRRNPFPGELVDASTTSVNAASMVIETSLENQPLSFRTRQHRVLIHRVLSAVGMLDPKLSIFPISNCSREECRKRGLLRVAVYDDADSRSSALAYPCSLLEQELSNAIRSRFSSSSHNESDFKARLTNETFERKGTADFIVQEVAVRLIGAPDIRDGVLHSDFFDVVVFLGSGAALARHLATALEGVEETERQYAKEALRSFIRMGGGYVGFGSGAILAGTSFSWGLFLLPVSTVETTGGAVDVEISTSSQRIRLPFTFPALLPSTQSGPFPPTVEVCSSFTRIEHGMAKTRGLADVEKGTCIVRGPMELGRVTLVAPEFGSFPTQYACDLIAWAGSSSFPSVM